MVTATVEFSEAVFVQGKPTIQLQIGPDTTNLVEAVFAGNSNHTFVQDDSGNYVELEAPFSDSITPSKLQAFTYVIKANDVGEVIIVDNKLNLDGGLILDAAGNAADLSYTEVNYHNDNAPYMDAPPTVAITMADSNGNAISGGLIKGETADVTFTFSEEVYSDLTNGISDAIVVENGSITEFQVYPVDSTKYTAKYTPNGNVESALNNISVSMADVKDFAGNSGVGITKSANFTVDTKIPTVQITMEDSNGEAISGALIKGDYANVAFTFSEEVFSVISSNIGDVISAKNGSITEFKVDGDDPTKYTAKYTPDNNVESALNKISVDMQGVKDTAGNTGDGIAQSDTYKVDTLSPTINLPGPDSGTKVVFDKENNTIEVALEFSEVINLKSGAALTLTLLVDDDNGEVDSVDVTFEAKNDLTSSNTYILTSTAPVVSGLFDINGIQVKANSLKVTRTDGEPAGFLQNFKDLAGNFLTGTFNEFTVVPDHSIDSRTHRATKQDEGYVSFSKLLPDIPSGDNKILDESNINTIDTIDTITGGDGLDQIFGGEGNEHLIGKAGNDFLKGGAGNDILDGGLGNDYLYADIGDDTINGGDGEDTILFDKVLEQTNKLVLDLFKDVSKQAYNAELGHNTISEIENAIGTNMGDVMNGNGYNNIINGADGDDIINGGRGNDKLLGGAGDDTLKGGRGKDTLEGGAGKDILNGGAGADTFVFTLADLTMTEDTGASGYFTSTHSDTVQRFNARADKIEIIGEYEGQVNLKEGKLFIDVKDDQGENNSSFDENTDWLLAEGFHDSITYNAGSGDVAFLDLSSFTEIV